MIDVRLYRAGFLPALAVLFVCAFSLRGLPAPVEPAAETLQFDAASALATARELERAAPEREPGSADAAAAAGIVRRELSEAGATRVAEQTFTASDGSRDVELRNLVLTLPGSTDEAIALVAGRHSYAESGSEASAAATGALLELAARLSVSGRDRTLIVASIDGAGTESAAIEEMLRALPERIRIDAAIVVAQPGASVPSQPHVVTSSGTEGRPSPELIETAAAAVSSRARAEAGLDGPLGQLARIAVPAAAGAQAALLAEGIDAVAISSAGEVPEGGDQSDPGALERFGGAALALAAALDASSSEPTPGPSRRLRIGGNTLPGWAAGALALALLVPPALSLGAALARRQAMGAWAWAAEWALVALAPLLALYLLALVGILPAPDVPFEPERFRLGVPEALALVLLAACAAGAWWALGLRRGPAGADRQAHRAAAGLVCAGACTVAWLGNPFLALVLVPLAHVPVAAAVLGAPAARALTLVALLPLAGALVHVGATLGWGGSAPWQLVLLVAGGGIGLIEATGITVALAATLAGSLALGADPQAPSRGRP